MSGWNRLDKMQKTAAKKPSAMRGVVTVAAIAFAVLGVICYFAFSGGSEPETKPARATGLIKEVTPEKVMKLLGVHRRTLDYYLDKGYLDRVYGGGKRAIIAAEHREGIAAG